MAIHPSSSLSLLSAISSILLLLLLLLPPLTSQLSSPLLSLGSVTAAYTASAEAPSYYGKNKKRTIGSQKDARMYSSGVYNLRVIDGYEIDLPLPRRHRYHVSGYVQFLVMGRILPKLMYFVLSIMWERHYISKAYYNKKHKLIPLICISLRQLRSNSSNIENCTINIIRTSWWHDLMYKSLKRN